MKIGGNLICTNFFLENNVKKLAFPNVHYQVLNFLPFIKKKKRALLENLEKFHQFCI